MTFKTLAALCAVAVAITGGMSGCSSDTSDVSDSGINNSSDQNRIESKTEIKNIAGYNAVVETTAPSAANCTIKFSESAAEVTGGAVDISGTTVTITRPGIYSVSGSCSGGKIIVSAAKGSEVTLILNGVDLKSTNGSVIECTGGKLLTLYLADGTENKLSDSANYSFGSGETEPDGAVYSKSDMIIAGGGSLTVNGLYKDGIKCKDTLSVNCGKLTVNAADDGITGKDCVVIDNGSFTVSAGGDGIKSTNSEDTSLGYITINGGEFNIASEADGIQAETALSVKGGTFKIVSGGAAADAAISASAGSMFDRDHRYGWGSTGSAAADDGSSQKGLKAGTDIVITNGDIDIKAADDSVHSNGNVIVNGGTLKLSSCDDGVHADELLEVNGGEITVSKSYEGLEGKNVEISGGVINIVASDDGLNAGGGDNGGYLGFNSAENYYISITGGNITVNADGDGIDSNGTIAQSGGVLTVYGPTNSGNGAIDYEKSYAISGGTLIALGSTGMAQAPSTLSQPCLSVNANVSANSVIEVRGEDGSVILSTTTPKSCQSLIFSCEQFKSGSKYGIYANGTLLSEVTATDGVSGGGANSQGNGGFGQGGLGHGGLGHGGGFDPNAGGDNNSDFRPGGDFDPNNSGNGGFRPGKDFDPNNSDNSQFHKGDKKFAPNNADAVTGATPSAGYPTV